MSPNRRALGVVLASLLVVLAGCTGFGGLSGEELGSESEGNATTARSSTTDAGTDGDTSTTSSTDDESTERASGSGSGALGETDSWFNLSEPGRYVFDIETAEDGNGRMVIETTDVTNGQATASVLLDVGEQSSEQTITAPVGEVEARLMATPAFTYITVIRLGGTGTVAAFGDDISVGQRFEQTTAEGSVHIEVTGTDSYAGVECYVVETQVNDTRSQEVCTRGAYDASPFVAIYDENGDLVDRIELVAYERG